MLNLEVRHALAKSVARKCVVVKLVESSQSTLHSLAERKAGAVVVLVPPPMPPATTPVLAFPHEYYDTPVYFVRETPELLALHEEVSQADMLQGSVLQQLLTSSHFFRARLDREPRPIEGLVVRNLQARLAGTGGSEPLPTVVVTASWDTLGLVPGLPGANAGHASATVALLELARLFSKLYTSSRTHPR
jgi:hypothetical protein